MTDSGSEEKVIIIGAGVAGLTLAQILRKDGIAYEIYDRDDGTHWQGWAIALDTCLDRLYPLLPDDIKDPREASPNFQLGKDDSFWILNAVTGECLGLAGNAPKGHPLHVIHANRAEFRKILMQHANVQFGKTFERYEVEEHGISAFFTDGTSTKGTVLVGADGASSRVRSQLLPGFHATVSPYTTLQGFVTLPKHLATQLFGPSNSGMLIADRNQKANNLVMHFDEDGSASFCWFLAYRVKEWENEQAWARHASGEELFEKAKERMGHWPDYLREEVEMTGSQGIHRPPIRLMETVIEEDELPQGRVTVLGDAMHSMLPFRGMGANMGISGACILGKGLMDGFRNNTPISDILRSYEREWIPQGRKVVLESRASGEGDENHDLSGGRLEERKKAAGFRSLERKD